MLNESFISNRPGGRGVNESRDLKRTVPSVGSQRLLLVLYVTEGYVEPSTNRLLESPTVPWGATSENLPSEVRSVTSLLQSRRGVPCISDPLSLSVSVVPDLSIHNRIWTHAPSSTPAPPSPVKIFHLEPTSKIEEEIRVCYEPCLVRTLSYFLYPVASEIHGGSMWCRLYLVSVEDQELPTPLIMYQKRS